jgi:hypothetical protein
MCSIIILSIFWPPINVKSCLFLNLAHVLDMLYSVRGSSKKCQMFSKYNLFYKHCYGVHTSPQHKNTIKPKCKQTSNKYDLENALRATDGVYFAEEA